MISPTNQKIAFIGGLHRSGTTLLASSLAKHPEISNLMNTNVIEDEGQFLQTVFPIDNVFGGPGRFAYDPRAHLTEQDVGSNRKEYASSLLNSWTPYWEADSTIRIEKTPANLIKSRFLQTIFPDAKFIFITRHPVPVALATRKWAKTSLFALVRHWLRAHEIMRSDMQHLNSCITVSYEQLVSEPQVVLSAIIKYLELPEVPINAKADPQVNNDYFEQWAIYGGSSRPIEPLLEGLSLFKKAVVSVRTRLKPAASSLMTSKRFCVSSMQREVWDVNYAFESDINRFGYSFYDTQIYPKINIHSSAAIERATLPGRDYAR